MIPTFRTTAPRLTTLAAALLLTPLAAGAQSMPSAREIVDRHIEASGGRAALERANTSVSEGTFNLPGAGLTGQLKTMSAPNRMRMQIDLPGLGTLLSGFDGTTAWGMDPIQGTRVMEGPERAAVVDGTKPGAAFRDSTVVSEMRTVAQDTIEGVACWKVAMKWKSGRESEDCFSVDTGLLHASTATQESPMGAISVTTVMKDYKEFGGVRVPTRIEQNVGGQQAVMTIDKVEIGQVPADAFALPPEVKALVDGK